MTSFLTMKLTLQKIKKAEKPAATRIKTLQDKKRLRFLKLSNSSSTFHYNANRSSSPTLSSAKYFCPQSKYSATTFQMFDLCFRCGKVGHWANSWRMRIQLSRNIDISEAWEFEQNSHSSQFVHGKLHVCL